MSNTARVTVTLPKEQVRHIRQKTDNVSGFIAEAVADRLRGEAIDEYLDAYQAEHGAIHRPGATRGRGGVDTSDPQDMTVLCQGRADILAA